MSKAVAAFAVAFKRGLQSGAYEPIDIIQTVQSVEKPADLLGCLDEYCRRFDPAKPPAKRETLELALAIGFTLFMQAVKMSDPVNGLAEMVQKLPTLDSREPDAKLKSKQLVYAKRYRALSFEDRGNLQAEARRRIKERAALKKEKAFLLDALAGEYRRKNGRKHESTAELMSVLGDAPDKRKAFEKVAAACESAWTAALRGKNRPTPSAAVGALDTAFHAYARHLLDELREPADFLRILLWLREAGIPVQKVVQKGGDTYRLSRATPLSSVWMELYLDAVARAQILAVTKWNIGSVFHAGGFAGADARFIFEPFTPRQAQLMRDRLTKGFNNIPNFTAFHRARRRSRVIGALLGLDILDEQESDDLAHEIARGWKQDAREVARRKITTASQREAFRSTFHINDTAKNVFTVLWIPKGPDPRFVFIEAHRLPGFFFKAYVRRVGLADMLEENAYKELAKNAQALTLFLLAYLMVLGYALDVATAGASGGLRFIILRFAEERLKEQALEWGFQIARIDNPWVQTLVGMGTNVIPSAIPSAKGLKIPQDLDLPPSAQRAIDTRPAAGAPKPPDRGTGDAHVPARAPAPAKTPGQVELDSLQARGARTGVPAWTVDEVARMEAKHITDLNVFAAKREQQIAQEAAQRAQRGVKVASVGTASNGIGTRHAVTVSGSGAAPPPPRGPGGPPGPGGGKGGAAADLQDAEGKLTPAGVAWIRRHFHQFTDPLDEKKIIRVADLTDDEDLGSYFGKLHDWVEHVVLAEIRHGWMGRPPKATDFLQANPHQNLNNFATKLEKAARAAGLPFDASVLKLEAHQLIKESGLQAIWERRRDDIVAKLHRLRKNREAAGPHARRPSDLEKMLEDQQSQMMKFQNGLVGAKRPDAVEVLLGQNEIVVWDPTLAIGNFMHAFKTRFYQEAIRRMLPSAPVEINGIDYRSLLRQRRQPTARSYGARSPVSP